MEETFGCRSFAFDAEKGFLLNGRPYPLCGAARHQDRAGLGSAIPADMVAQLNGILNQIPKEGNERTHQAAHI